jgi:hypothetical protein
MSDELESGDFAQLVVPAWYRPCVHGGGWWETEDVDGRKVLLGVETPALDAMLAKAREDALREAAVELECNWGHVATPEMRNAILALIPTGEA